MRLRFDPNCGRLETDKGFEYKGSWFCCEECKKSAEVGNWQEGVRRMCHRKIYN